MRNLLILLGVLVGAIAPASAQLGVGINVAVPGVSIGVTIPAYPRMLRVPGQPVYYAADLSLNLFFHDGFWWIYQYGNWYRSAWYDGPWALVAPDLVPVFILQVPLRYYRLPPLHFGGWLPDAPPRWGEHWGGAWAARREGWDQREHWPPPPLAPLPMYQRRFGGEHYPSAEQQREMHERHYPYRPRDRGGPAPGPPSGARPPEGRSAGERPSPRRPAGHNSSEVPPPEVRSGGRRGDERGGGDHRGGDRSR